MLFDQLKENDWVIKNVEKYYSLELREQLALKVCVVFFLVLGLYFFVISPAISYQSRAELEYRQNLALYSLIKSNENAFSDYQASSVAQGQSLLGLANSSSKSFGFNFKRYEPLGDDELSLWMEKVPFNNLVRWLERLDKQYGIRVNDIDVDKNSNQNTVDVRLVLQG